MKHKKVLIFTTLLLLAFPTTYTQAQDFILDLLDPIYSLERRPEVPIGYDFEEDFFSREYFYEVNDGTLQLRNSPDSPWTSLDLKLAVAKPGDQTLREGPSESFSRPPDSDDVRSQITKPGAESVQEPESPEELKNKKTREDVLRELEKTVGVPRY